MNVILTMTVQVQRQQPPAEQGPQLPHSQLRQAGEDLRQRSLVPTVCYCLHCNAVCTVQCTVL